MYLLYKNDQFHLISKALQHTQHSLNEHGYGTELESFNHAKEDFIKAVAHASDLNNEMLIRTLYTE